MILKIFHLFCLITWTEWNSFHTHAHTHEHGFPGWKRRDSGTYNRAKSWSIREGRRHFCREKASLTGLCRIMDTLFFCSIILKSWRRSGAMFLSRKYSGLFSSTLSKYRSLWGAVVGGGEVTTAARVSPFIAQSFSVPTESKYKKVLCLNQRPIISSQAHQPDKHNLQRENIMSDWVGAIMCEASLWPRRHRAHQPSPTLPLNSGIFRPRHCSSSDNRRTSSQSYYVLCQTEK